MSRISVGAPIPVTSIVIRIAGDDPVMSITPVIGTRCPETSMSIATLAVVIFRAAALTVARNLALSMVRGLAGADEPLVSEVAGVLAWGSEATEAVWWV